MNAGYEEQERQYRKSDIYAGVTVIGLVTLGGFGIWNYITSTDEAKDEALTIPACSEVCHYIFGEVDGNALQLAADSAIGSLANLLENDFGIDRDGTIKAMKQFDVKVTKNLKTKDGLEQVMCVRACTPGMNKQQKGNLPRRR